MSQHPSIQAWDGDPRAGPNSDDNINSMHGYIICIFMVYGIVAVQELTTTQFYNIQVYSTVFYQPVVPSVPPEDLFTHIYNFLVLHRHPP